MLRPHFGMWKTIHHYAHAATLRVDLFCEVVRAEKQGTKLPRWIRSRIWRNPGTVEDMVRLLRFLRPDEQILLLDAGGNDGTWCEFFLDFFPNTQVLGFEPTAEQYAHYRKRFADNPNVKAFQVALSDRSGHAEINVGMDSGRTSLLEYSETQQDLRIQFRGVEEVKLEVLDKYDIVSHAVSKIFLKVDVQGHEVEVLKGATKSLDHIDVVLVECSFAEEYKNTLPSFARASSLLLDHGFYPVIFRDYGRHLSPYAWERDVIFVKLRLIDALWGW